MFWPTAHDALKLTNNLFDELPKAWTVAFALEHLAINRDLGIERLQIQATLAGCKPRAAHLLGIKQHLQLDHERAALFAHLSNLVVFGVERVLVIALIVFDLVVELQAGVFAFDHIARSLTS